MPDLSKLAADAIDPLKHKTKHPVVGLSETWDWQPKESDLVAAARLLRAQSWRKISDVPHDGSPILVCYMSQGRVTRVVRWSKLNTAWYDGPQHVPGLEYQDVLCLPLAPILPDPPEQEQKP